jgi:ActR/RegA family two-component response regulator
MISLTFHPLDASEQTLSIVHASLLRLNETLDTPTGTQGDAQPPASAATGSVSLQVDDRPQVALWVVESQSTASACEALRQMRLLRPQAVHLVWAWGLLSEGVEQLMSVGAFDFIRHPASDEEVALRLRRARAWLALSLATARESTDDGEVLQTVESFQAAKARVVQHFERSYIERLLRASDGNISRAARIAKKNRRAFFELIRKHEIDAEQFRMTLA